jgi:hypothetical protein
MQYERRVPVLRVGTKLIPASRFVGAKDLIGRNPLDFRTKPTPADVIASYKRATSARIGAESKIAPG